MTFNCRVQPSEHTHKVEKLLFFSQLNMVSSKRREILERYRFLLEFNLVLTDELVHWYRIRRVLPEFILDDLKVCL